MLLCCSIYRLCVCDVGVSVKERTLVATQSTAMGQIPRSIEYISGIVVSFFDNNHYIKYPSSCYQAKKQQYASGVSFRNSKLNMGGAWNNWISALKIGSISETEQVKDLVLSVYIKLHMCFHLLRLMTSSVEWLFKVM